MNRSIFALGAAALLAVGCGGAGPAAVSPTAKQASKPKRSVVEAAQEPESTEKKYSYNSIGKRDPFRSFIQRTVEVVVDGQPRGPLQMHEIDQYRLRGIVWNLGAPRALVEDPAGIGHVVELGTLMGKNWGKVTQIKPEEIVITEEYRDPIENELIINEITVRLPRDGEEKKP